jgi:integrase
MGLTAAGLIRLQPPAEGIKELWDDRVRGLSLRVYASGRATWSFRYRLKAGSGNKRASVGEYPAVGLAEAREEAMKLRGRVSLGADPQAERAAEKQSITFEKLIERYMIDEVEPKRKHATRLLYRGYFKNHVPAALKRKKAAHVTRGDLAKLHRDIGEDHPASANRILTAISGVFTWGFRHGYLATEANPARLIQKFKEEGRERFLSGEELGRLGETLRKAETEGLPWPEYESRSKHQRKARNQRTVLSEHSAAAIRLLLFTGCRLREILHLRWDEVDFENGLLRLSDSKSGRKPVVLNAPALDILAGLKRFGPFVIAGSTTKKPRADLKRVWDLVKANASLNDVRLHDLRHTHASAGVNSGISLFMVGHLLGHRHESTTAKYAHLANDPVKQASNRIGALLASQMAATLSTSVRTREKVA